MSRHELIRDGAALSGIDTGEGPTVVFQHGLGADKAQVAAHFPEEGFRRLTLECRAQGKSEPGDPSAFAIQTFADDVLAFADARGVERFAIGGISMGAAIALNIAVNHPDRVTALILARPAWAFEKAPENMRPLAEVASYLPQGNKEAFEKSDLGRRLAIEAPDNLASMLGFFGRADLATTAKLLSAIAADGPGVTAGSGRRHQGSNSRHRQRPRHRASNGFGEIARQRHIPGAQFIEIAPKSLDKSVHAQEFKAVVNKFLTQKDITS